MSDALPLDRVPRPPPRLVPLDGRTTAGAHLPTPLTTLIGRDHDTRAVVRELLRDDVRLLTFTGPAGVGKTRLAIRAAAELEDAFDHGARFVELASISDPALVLPTIARELGVWEAPHRTIPEGLRDFLGDRHLLLVLDNFEQVAPAAPFLIELLQGCPRLKLLLTSRALLRLSAEHVYTVPPLAVPDLDRMPSLSELEHIGAVRLFVQRARAIRSEFALSKENGPAVAAICRRVEGVPLAVELAAARVAHLPPRAMLARLTPALPLLTGGQTDAPARQRTMRDAIAWSNDLLSDPEQRAFRILSVFVGGSTLTAAEAVWNAHRPPHAELLSTASSLVDKSLLQQREDPDGEPRFTMLESVREFGLEQLAASGEEGAIRSAHADYFLALAEHAAPLLAGAEQRLWLDRLEREMANVRSALDWFLEQNGDERSLRLAGSLEMLWYVRNHLHEGADMLQRALAAAADRPSIARADALRAAGMLAHARGDYAAAARHLQASLDIGRALQVRRIAALALEWLGVGAEYQGDDDLARTHYEAALALFRELADPYWTAFTLSNLGDTAHRLGDLNRADALCAEAMSLARQLGDKYLLWMNLGSRGTLELARQAWDHASAAHDEELTVALDIGDMRGVADALAGLGAVAIGRRRFEEGAKLLAAADALREAIGRSKLPGHAQIERARTAAQQAMGDGGFRAAWAAGNALALDHAVAAARSVAESAPDAPAAIDEQRSQQVALTPREIDVLRLLVEGRTDKEIAATLFVSRRTAAGHVASILAKLGAVSRTDAAVRAVRSGLV